MKTERRLLTNGSRGNWGVKLEKDEEERLIAPPNFLRDGALLRIADALELLTKDKAEMEKENPRLRSYKTRTETQECELKVERHRCASLRGYITRIKKQTKKG
jgi:hypothetical protein